MPPRNILPYAAFYASVAGLSLGYLWVNRSTLVPKARQATQWLREVSADFAQIHVIEPVKNIYTELVYREHYTLGKAETIKRQLEHSQQQFQKVFALWQNAAKVSMGEARLKELGDIDTESLRQLRLEEQVRSQRLFSNAVCAMAALESRFVTRFLGAGCGPALLDRERRPAAHAAAGDV